MATIMQSLKACFAISLALALAACATTLGRDFNEEAAQQIQSGETTKSQVLERLGRPSLRKGTKEEEVWTYAYYTGPGPVRWFFQNNATEDAQYGRGNQKRLIVVFSGDVVKSSNFTREIPEPH